jgi:hypothetical protein
MLTLSEAQWRKLQAHDTRQFVATVCDQFLCERPDMVQAPGSKVVLERMQAAHDYAALIGFSSAPHVVRLMYLAADAPGIHDDLLIDGYLRKPGAAPEQRLDDLLAVMNNKLREKS